MKRILRDERGMALAVAIFALVVVGALVAGAFFAGTQEQRVGENQRRVQTSFGVAEAGAQERVLSWDPATMNKRPLYCNCAGGDSVAIGPDLPTPNGTGSYGGYSYKVGPNLFLIDVTGRDRNSAAGVIAGGGGARQRIGMIARIAPIDFGIRASLTTQGTVSMGGNATVNGTDQVPAGWASCDPPGPSQAGVRDQGGNVTESGNANVTGTPPVVNDQTINSNTFTTFGGATYAQLAARATITIPEGNYSTDPVTAGGNCDKTVLTNWGDGMNQGQPCSNYFPIIHATGTITLNNTQGQGILLVDGDVNVQGSYQFFGIVIIQGDLKTAGGGTTDAHFWGGVMAKNADLSDQSLSGNATLNFSSCAILTVLQAQSPISMMRSRGWVQLF
ncbi:MAG TPA: pilus assembly PilX N-terminal domain-containing protein [Gemmatimonadales bacterium]|nr:pilus assembly PilX N-terminal domain-containing protein [Gemmatimonadales bacterium]